MKTPARGNLADRRRILPKNFISHGFLAIPRQLWSNYPVGAFVPEFSAPAGNAAQRENPRCAGAAGRNRKWRGGRAKDGENHAGIGGGLVIGKIRAGILSLLSGRSSVLFFTPAVDWAASGFPAGTGKGPPKNNLYMFRQGT
jgi:hypothetical protein